MSTRQIISAMKLVQHRAAGFTLRVAIAGRWFRVVLWLLAGALSGLKFLNLTADFPNDSPWMIDQAKFTDEGWWGNAAIRQALTGDWYLAGDYNPAIALPVWPALLAAVFHFTGAGVAAARALSVGISIATAGLVYLLMRRFQCAGSHVPALVAVLLFSASPFAFVFSRLAILDTLVIFEFCLALLIASYASAGRAWIYAVLPVVVASMLLTKTTSAMLVAAIFWIAWSAAGRKPAAVLPSIVAAAAAPAAIVGGYAAVVAARGYGADYRYFFAVNAMPAIDWRSTSATVAEFLNNCLWIDRVLYPVGLAILAVSLFKRRLWSNALFSASWLAMGAQAVFIFSRQEDYAPRYFLAMLVPLLMVVTLTLSELMQTSSKAAGLLLLALAVSIFANLVTMGRFVTHPTYDLRDAAQQIKQIVRSHPEQRRLMLGVSADQISLMTGIPALNDGYGTEDMAQKVARYQPGWYLAWNDIPLEQVEYLTPYRLEKMASFAIFDDEDRTTLTLYKMVPRGSNSPSGLVPALPFR